MSEWFMVPLSIFALRCPKPSFYIKETAEREVQDLPAGGLGVSPSFKISPKIGGYRGLTETISAVSINITNASMREIPFCS